MNKQEEVALCTTITQLEYKLADLSKSVSKACVKLIEMRIETERLKALRDGRQFDQHIGQVFNSHSPRLLEAFYNDVYRTVDDEYDLPQPLLARLVRDCVNNQGVIPSSKDRDAVAKECPHVLEAIERAHTGHALKLLKGILNPPDAQVSSEDMSMLHLDDGTLHK